MSRPPLGPVFFTVDPATGRKGDAPILGGMAQDPAAQAHHRRTVFELAVEAGMPEEEARRLFLKAGEDHG